MCAGIDRLRKRLKDRFPKEASAIDAYLSLCKYISFLPFGLFFAAKMVPAWIGALMQPLVNVLFHRWSDRSTTQVHASVVVPAPTNVACNPPTLCMARYWTS